MLWQASALMPCYGCTLFHRAYIPHFVYGFTCWQTLFPPSAIVNNDAMNTGVQVFVRVPVFSSVRLPLGGKVLGPIVILSLAF